MGCHFPISEFLISKTSFRLICASVYPYVGVTWSTKIHHAVASPIYNFAVYILSLVAAVWTNYCFRSASSLQVVFTEHFQEEGMSPDCFELCLSILLDDQIKRPVKMYSMVTHVVPIRSEPDPAAIFFRIGAIGSSEDVVFVQVSDGSS